MHRASELKLIFEEYLVQERFNNDPPLLYAPVNYILALGGKRFRPILVLLAYEMYHDKIPKALPLALSVEMFHNFSLVHDDIMDDADIRRGKSSVHKKFGINTAILSGDLMLIYAFEFILNSNLQNKQEVMSDFSKMAIHVCQGQQMDMEFETRAEIAISEYLEMIEKKTAVLMGAALKMGALAGGASNKDAYHLYQYGKNLGIAFQIQDDVLDAFADPGKFGKTQGGDIMQGKKTFLYIKARELMGKNQVIEFDKLYMSVSLEPEQKVREVKKIFNEYNVAEYARQTQEAYAQLSESHLQSLQIPDSKSAQLRKLSRKLFEREV